MTAHIHLLGRLGRDPVTRPAGDKTVTELTIASDVGTKDAKRTVWYKVSVWGTRGATAARLLAKGRLVYVFGKHDEEHWTDRENRARVTQCVKDASWYFADDAPSEASATTAASKPLADGRPVAPAPARDTHDEPPF